MSAAFPRKVKLFIACSLDGYIARADGTIDWLFQGGDYGYADFIETIDTVLMGRKTWELALSFGEYPYPGVQAYVFTRGRAAGRDPRAEYVSGSPRALIERLRARPGKDLWLVGGGELIRDFVEEDLIDEFMVFVHPRLIGSGIALFPRNRRELSLRLRATRAWDDGLVLLHYERLS